MSRLVIAMITVCALGALPATAFACSPEIGAPTTPPPPDNTPRDWGIAFGVVGAIDVAIIGAQLATIGDMFPGWAAGIELALGIAHQVTAAVTGFAFAIGTINSCGPGTSGVYSLAATGALITVGGWLLAHAIWSLSDPDDVAPSVSIGRDGFELGLIGRF